MKIFDAHFHLDKGLDGYNINPLRRNCIFNFVAQYLEQKHLVPKIDTTTLIFDYKNNWNLVKNEIESKKIQGIKIHSRLLGIKDADYQELFIAFSEISSFRLPVIMDAFYFGHDLEVQPNLVRITEMIKLFPDTTFIIAHSGGIKVLEYFLHLKNLPNVVFELSLSLAYLKHASVFQDFKVLLKFGDRKRIIWGTDFPYINPQNQLDAYLEIAGELKINDAENEDILFGNADHLFGTKNSNV